VPVVFDAKVKEDHYGNDRGMATTAVLAIGLDPCFGDFSAMAQFTPELVRAYIDAEIARVREAGFEVDLCLITPGATFEAEVEAALRAGSFECVVIGAGLREPPEHLLLFEKILNFVHRFAPEASIAFNTTPADTAEAVQRWVAPRLQRFCNALTSGSARASLTVHFLADKWVHGVATNSGNQLISADSR
jgi:hypothetical protein